MRQTFLLLPLIAVRFVAGGKIQKEGLQLPQEYAAHREEVKQIFRDAYGVYKRFAFGHDEVKPVSQTPDDPLGGWGASIVDGMSTMLIMGLDDLYAEALRHVSQTDFSIPKSGSGISLFETTIRYIGGMLSAYELNGKKDQILVAQAKMLGDKLAVGWVGVNALPFNNIDFARNAPATTDGGNCPAAAGTLVIEWARLSEYTGDKRYGQLAERSMRALANSNDVLLPGLVGANLRETDASPTTKYITWGGGTDSYFEYLIKYARLTNNADTLWVNTWKTAVESSLTSLAVRTSPKNWLMLADMDDNRTLQHHGSHLECFHGGNFIMGGQLLNNNTILTAGLELADACMNTYGSTSTGIGPEGFSYLPGGASTTPTNSLDPDQPHGADVEFNQQHGFWVTNGAYGMRPEVLESNFYAWRATGDKKYLDNAVKALRAFRTYLRVPSNGGYSLLGNVMDKNGGRIDSTASFFFAETLKYLYLTFDDPAHISLDDYVFNTEAHPFKAPAPLSMYDGPPGPSNPVVSPSQPSGAGTNANAPPKTNDSTTHDNSASVSRLSTWSIALAIVAGLLLQ